MSEYIQQAQNFLEKTGTKFESKFKKFGSMEWDKSSLYGYTKLDSLHHDFIVKINRKLEEIKPKKVLKNQKNEIVNPSEYDVLTCLTKYDAGTFENFCGDFGYDTDSRSAERTYKAVVIEWENVSKLFSESEIEELQEIQ